MAVKQEMDKMAGTVQEMTRAQQATLRATQKWWADGVGLAQRQQKTARFAQNRMLFGFEAFQRQAEQDRNLADSMVENARRRQEGLQTPGNACISACQSFFAPLTDQVEENVKTMKSATKSGPRSR